MANALLKEAALAVAKYSAATPALLTVGVTLVGCAAGMRADAWGCGMAFNLVVPMVAVAAATDIALDNEQAAATAQPLRKVIQTQSFDAGCGVACLSMRPSRLNVWHLWRCVVRDGNM